MSTIGNKRRNINDFGKPKKTEPSRKVRRSVVFDEDDEATQDHHATRATQDSQDSQATQDYEEPQTTQDPEEPQATQDPEEPQATQDSQATQVFQDTRSSQEIKDNQYFKKNHATRKFKINKNVFRKNIKSKKFSNQFILDESEAEEVNDFDEDTDGEEEPADGISIGSQDSMDSFIVNDDEELSEYESSRNTDDDSDYVESSSSSSASSSSSSSSSLNISSNDKISLKISSLKKKIEKLGITMAQKTLKMEALQKLQEATQQNKSPSTPETNEFETLDDEYQFFCMGCDAPYNGNSQFCSRSCFYKNC